LASLNQTFDASSVEPSTPFEILPAGKYVAHIVNSEMKDTKNGNGKYLQLELTVLDGEFSGRRLFERLNLVNPNAQAVEISQRTLSAICRATGQMQVSDSEQLHYKPMLVTVKVRPAGPDRQGIERAAQNEIGGYEQANSGSIASYPPPRAATAAPKPATAAATPPWRRTA
jgi:hypothetical protein